MDRKMFCGGHELYSSNIIGGRRFDDQSTSLDEQRSTEQCISSKLSVYFYSPYKCYISSLIMEDFPGSLDSGVWEP